MRNITGAFLLGCLLGTLGLASAVTAETPGERFRKAIERETEYCATHKIKPANRRCDITKLQPADPLATEEGRFAHSIKIPNPVPPDSGYKPSMTPQEYFDHLCKTEAGEFIFRPVENVEGFYMMRPRYEAHFEYNHLYAFEDPYGHWNEEATEPEMLFVGPSRYSFLETPLVPRTIPDWKHKQLHPSMMSLPEASAKYMRFFGYDGLDSRTMQKAYVVSLKSRYGYTWRGITRPHDRELGIAGSEAIILDIQTNEVLAVHRGYAQFDIDKTVAGNAAMQWWKRCPFSSRKAVPPRQDFIQKVLKPSGSSLEK